MSQRDAAPAQQNLANARGKPRLRKVVSGSLTGVAALIVRIICKTMRVRTVDEGHYFDIRAGKILCLWHGRPLPPTARMLGVDLTVLISLSRDGEMINDILATMGFPALRGSTGPSGARALAACIKLLRNGGALVVTPDGPRGPSGRAQAGVLTMSRKSGCAIVPSGSSARPRLVMKSWDRFIVPLPFARGLVIFGEPIYVPADADEALIEELRRKLENEMRRLQDEADRRLGMPTYAEIASKRPL